MKIKCQEGFRCREHCQDHCYDQYGVLWEEHYMFCGEDEATDTFREINSMNTNIFKLTIITLALTFNHCAMANSVANNNMVNVLRVLQSKESMAQHRIAQLEEYIKNLESIDSTANFSQIIKNLREAATDGISRLERIESTLKILEQVDRDKLSTEERLKNLEEYVAKLEQEASQVLAIM